jgi:hypothetical protein
MKIKNNLQKNTWRHHKGVVFRLGYFSDYEQVS